jgi:hypothetical protein
MYNSALKKSREREETSTQEEGGRLSAPLLASGLGGSRWRGTFKDEVRCRVSL